MQNTILIHAPGRRQGRGALVLAYTALFALLMGIWAAIFALKGRALSNMAIPSSSITRFWSIMAAGCGRPRAVC